MTSPHDAPSPAPPFLLDRDLLDRNLEVKRAEGFPCPHCAQNMEWNLGPKTKGAIIDALAQGNLHEAFLFCDKNDCPSVQRDGNDSLVNPFVRRISAVADGTITIETLPLDDLLKYVASLRQLNRDAIREVTGAAAAIASETRRADETSRTLGERNAETARTEAALRQAREENTGLSGEMEEKGRKLGEAREEIERLEGILTEIDRIAGVTNPEDRLAVIQDLVREAQRMAEACRLTNTTPAEILEKARRWAAKQGGRK